MAVCRTDERGGGAFEGCSVGREGMRKDRPAQDKMVPALSKLCNIHQPPTQREKKGVRGLRESATITVLGGGHKAA